MSKLLNGSGSLCYSIDYNQYTKKTYVDYLEVFPIYYLRSSYYVLLTYENNTVPSGVKRCLLKVLQSGGQCNIGQFGRYE